MLIWWLQAGGLLPQRMNMAGCLVLICSGQMEGLTRALKRQSQGKVRLWCDQVCDCAQSSVCHQIDLPSVRSLVCIQVHVLVTVSSVLCRKIISSLPHTGFDIKQFASFTEEEYVCTTAFTAEGPDEISMEIGAIVLIVEKNLQGWWKVRWVCIVWVILPRGTRSYLYTCNVHRLHKLSQHRCDKAELVQGPQRPKLLACQH